MLLAARGPSLAAARGGRSAMSSAPEAKPAAGEGEPKPEAAKKLDARARLQAAVNKAKNKLNTAQTEKEDKRAKLAEAVKKLKGKLTTATEPSAAPPKDGDGAGGGKKSDEVDPEAMAAYQEAMKKLEEPVDMESPVQQAYLSLVALGQIAEESCTFATSAATFVASSGTFDVNETSQMSVAAQQASDRARSACETLVAYTKEFEGLKEAKEWVQSLVMKVQKDAEQCEQAAQSCHHLSSAISKNKKSTTSPVPCRWFLQGKCRQGMACTFLHDLSVLTPRPLTKKTTKLCRFFETREGCIRGPSCPHAHGDKELERIKELVAKMKKRKMYKLHEAETPWVEDEYSDQVMAATKPALMPLPFLPSTWGGSEGT